MSIQKVSSRLIEAHVQKEGTGIAYFDDDMFLLTSIGASAEDNPVQMEMHMVAVCLMGRGVIEFNGEEIEVGKNDLIVYPQNTSMRVVMSSHDFTWIVLGFSPRMLQEFMHGNMHIWTDAIYRRRYRRTRLTDEDLEHVRKYYELGRMMLSVPLEDNDEPFRREMLHALMKSGIMGLCILLREHKDDITSVDKDRNTPLAAGATATFQQFLQILGNTRVKHQSLEYYANQLCITPKYLSHISKTASGKTASEWVNEYLVEDIRYYVTSTAYSMKEISNLLGFPDPSFFGRFVRRHFGMTPVELREKKHDGTPASTT